MKIIELVAEQVVGTVPTGKQAPLPPTTPTGTPPQASTPAVAGNTAPLADPRLQAAQLAKQKQDKEKQKQMVQDQIKAAQQQLADLQKQQQDLNKSV